MTKQLTTRGQAGLSLLAFGVLLMAASGAMVFRAAPAFAADQAYLYVCHVSPGNTVLIQIADDGGAEVPDLQGHQNHENDWIEGIQPGYPPGPTDDEVIAYCNSVTTTTTTSTTTTTTLGTTTTTIGGPTTTTTTLGATTTTTLGGPCSPNDPECLPNTGGSNLMSVLLAGLGLLLAGVGLLALANERRRVLTR
jgi:LPXTG-motif cell wall-anchored protein